MSVSNYNLRFKKVMISSSRSPCSLISRFKASNLASISGFSPWAVAVGAGAGVGGGVDGDLVSSVGGLRDSIKSNDVCE